MQKPSDDQWDQVWVGANIATFAEDDSYGSLVDAGIAIKGDRIAWIGTAAEGRRLAGRRLAERRLAERGLAGAQPIEVHEARGAWITPGLIDCHTHLVYGGNRVAEFEQRLCGASYEEIARAGGGIQSTVNATRAATRDALYQSAATRLHRLMAEGVTTLEIKSGYGLELSAERRLLEVARELGKKLPVSVKTTFLGLHSLPPDYAEQRAEFVDAVSGPWLRELAGAGLVDAVDGFCEGIAFSPAEVGQLLRAAQKLGLPAHVHAGQLSDMGAVELAAQWHALSADHLEFVSEAGALAMAAAGTVGVLLPTAYFTLRQTTPPPISLLRDSGVRLAVATDCNPGTSPCTSILLAMNMACTVFRLTPQEALAGATRHAAAALGELDQIGTLEVGKRADLAFWQIERPAELCYALGANPLLSAMHRGVMRTQIPSAR